MKKNPPLTCFFTHKLLRATLAVTQAVDARKRDALSATLIGIAQPTLPETLSLLQPLVEEVAL